MTVALCVDRPHLEPGRIEQLEELLVRLVGTFRILADGRTLYCEREFPFLELGVALSRWLSIGLPVGKDFEFDSMSSAEPGLVWIRSDSAGWRIGSTEQEFPLTSHLSDADLIDVIQQYINTIRSLVPRDLDFWSDEMLGGAL